MPALGLRAEADLASSVCCTTQRPRTGIFRHIQSITYTYRQKLSNIFGDTVSVVAERNMLVMQIKYFDFFCKFYYFYEH